MILPVLRIPIVKQMAARANDGFVAIFPFAIHGRGRLDFSLGREVSDNEAKKFAGF